MSGVDILNQFPDSKMANAVKLGQSRFMSADVPSIPFAGSELNNVDITSIVGLNSPLGSTYAVVTADGGPLYVTYDGTAPSATNYAVSIAEGQSLPVQGVQALIAARVFGTNVSVSFWK